MAVSCSCRASWQRHRSGSSVIEACGSSLKVSPPSLLPSYPYLLYWLPFGTRLSSQQPPVAAGAPDCCRNPVEGTRPFSFVTFALFPYFYPPATILDSLAHSYSILKSFAQTLPCCLVTADWLQRPSFGLTFPFLVEIEPGLS